ncbi:MAG: hypothetical protein GX442_04545 [Candidatus Riflebacteria bacterium]|nr:hypothetical protein [Candidatus Riflebacteria bacterium]
MRILRNTARHLIVLGCITAVLAAQAAPGTAARHRPMVVTGDLSHRSWVKTVTENAKGKESTKRVIAGRLRFFLDGRDGGWDWRFSLSTIDNQRLTSALLCLGRDEKTPLGPAQFQITNLYGQRACGRAGGRLRLGRTQVPFLKNKSEMLWDNDIYWDGLWTELPFRPGATAAWHGGAFLVHRDLRFRGDRLFVLGALGKPHWGKVQAEWRLDHFDYHLDPAWWRGNLAPGYRTVNLYGAVDLPGQVRLTLDAARNLRAVGPERGRQGLNATLVLGRMKHDRTFQGIVQWLRVGAQVTPPAFVSYEKRLNMEGTHLTAKFRLTKHLALSADYLDWHRLDGAVPTDRRYRRWETSADLSF